MYEMLLLHRLYAWGRPKQSLLGAFTGARWKLGRFMGEGGGALEVMGSGAVDDSDGGARVVDGE